jgi:SAM-dependent methyltransferase
MPGLRRAGGQSYDAICREIRFSSKNYFGIEWNHASIRPGRHRGLNIIRGDLNSPLPYRDRTFACVFALSVLEHLTNGCRFILECRRVLQLTGRLVLLTPNISTFISIV